MSNSDSPSEQDIMWSQTTLPSTQTIAYTGEKLEPGFTYKWELISHGKPYSQTITIMEQSQREAIAAELTALVNQLPNNATEEDIAIARANYFLQQELGSDALQELYSVPNPSPNLTSEIKAIKRHLCNLDR